MDGDALIPALGKGFKGAPTSEQMKTLYDMAEKGKLVYFRMADAKPLSVTHEGVHSIDMNPKKPVEPVKPADNANISVRRSYDTELMRYPYRMKIYERNIKALNSLGEGFKAALDTYNGSINMQTEQNELMKNSDVLKNFRTKYDHRELLLDDVVQMAKLYTNAINIEGSQLENNKQMQNTMNKQNNMQNEQPMQSNPMTK